MAPTLADLRYAFYGTGSAESVSDAEYRELLALYDQGITLSGIASGSQKERNLREAVAGDWTQHLLTADDSVSAGSTLTFEHGRAVIRGSGAGTGVRSSRRSAFEIPNSPGGYSRIISRWSGRSYPAALVPGHGHVHGLGIQADGKRRGVVVSHDVFFAVYSMSAGIWECNADGTGFSVLTTPVGADSVVASAGSRTTNVVTLTVPTGHGFVEGDVIDVNMTDDVYDGIFPISSVTATTIVYSQTAADDASSGTGTVQLARSTLIKNGLLRSIDVSAAVRTSGVVTATVGAGHPFAIGDSINVDLTDNTYDGQFFVSAVGETSVTWKQNVADDAAGGTGTVFKAFPYWCESVWTGEQINLRVWPDIGATTLAGSPVGAGIGGPLVNGPPPWESVWATAINLAPAGVNIPDPDLGVGCCLLATNLASGSTITSVAYDNVSTEVALAI